MTRSYCIHFSFRDLKLKKSVLHAENLKVIIPGSILFSQKHIGEIPETCTFFRQLSKNLEPSRHRQRTARVHLEQWFFIHVWSWPEMLVREWIILINLSMALPQNRVAFQGSPQQQERHSAFMFRSFRLTTNNNASHRTSCCYSVLI